MYNGKPTENASDILNGQHGKELEFNTKAIHRNITNANKLTHSFID